MWCLFIRRKMAKPISIGHWNDKKPFQMSHKCNIWDVRTNINCASACTQNEMCQNNDSSWNVAIVPYDNNNNKKKDDKKKSRMAIDWNGERGTSELSPPPPPTTTTTKSMTNIIMRENVAQLRRFMCGVKEVEALRKSQCWKEIIRQMLMAIIEDRNNKRIITFTLFHEVNLSI